MICVCFPIFGLGGVQLHCALSRLVTNWPVPTVNFKGSAWQHQRTHTCCTHWLYITQAHKNSPHTQASARDAAPETLHPGKPKATSNTQSVPSSASSTPCCDQRQSCPSVVDCHKVLPVAANIHAPAAAAAATKATAAAAAGAVTCQLTACCAAHTSQRSGAVRVATHAAKVHACPSHHPATPLPQPPLCGRRSAAGLRYQSSGTTSSS